jgi:hypothetical protein
VRQVWFTILQTLSLIAISPQPNNKRMVPSCWCHVKLVPKEIRKGSQFSHHSSGLGDLEIPECVCLQWWEDECNTGVWCTALLHFEKKDAM